MSSTQLSFKAVVLCAKYEEAQQFREVFKHQSAVEQESSVGSLLHHILNLKDSNNNPFEVRVYCPRNKAGSVMIAIDVLQLLRDLSPDWVFMTGVCAGNPSKTVLGDVIIAEKVVDSRSGRIETNMTHHDIRMVTIDEFLNTAINEVKGHLKGQWREYITISRPISDRYKREVILQTLYERRREIQDQQSRSKPMESNLYTVQDYGLYLPDIAKKLPDQEYETKENCQRLLQKLQYCNQVSYCAETDQYYLNQEQFREVEKRIRNTTFPNPDNPEPSVYCGTVMTDVSAVRADIDEKKWIQYGEELGARDLYGLDMEGIGLYQAIESLNREHSRSPTKVMMVKGVSDLADTDKDYQFHTYGKQVSAAFVYEFLRRYGYKLIHDDKTKKTR